MGLRDAASRWWHRYTGEPAAVWATIFATYLAARVVIIAGGVVYDISPDAAVYAPRDDPSRNHGPLVDFTGHAPRPWGVPLFYAVFGSDQGRVVGQWALASLAWVLFAWETSRRLSTRTARYALAAALLLLACLGEVASWDLAILTESLSISIGLLVLTLLLRWRRTGSRAALAGLTAAAAWWTFVRPDIRVFTVVLAALLVAVAVRSWRRGGATDRTSTKAALAAAAVLVGAIGWYAAITPGMDRAMVAYDPMAISPPLPQPEAMRVFRLRVDVSRNPQLWEAFRTELGMPTCPGLEALRGEERWLEQEWAHAYTQCPELVTWVQARTDENFWRELAVKDPVLAARAFFTQVSLTLGGSQYAQVPTVVPQPVERLVFPSRRYGLPGALFFFGAALALALWTRAHRTNASLVWTAVGIFAVAVGSAVATIAVHSGEIWRYGVQETYATRVAVILTLAGALDAWARRRHARGVSSPGAATPGRAQATA